MWYVSGCRLSRRTRSWTHVTLQPSIPTCCTRTTALPPQSPHQALLHPTAPVTAAKRHQQHTTPTTTTRRKAGLLPTGLVNSQSQQMTATVTRMVWQHLTLPLTHRTTSLTMITGITIPTRLHHSTSIRQRSVRPTLTTTRTDWDTSGICPSGESRSQHRYSLATFTLTSQRRTVPPWQHPTIQRHQTILKTLWSSPTWEFFIYYRGSHRTVAAKYYSGAWLDVVFYSFNQLHVLGNTCTCSVI